MQNITGKCKTPYHTMTFLYLFFLIIKLTCCVMLRGIYNNTGIEAQRCWSNVVYCRANAAQRVQITVKIIGRLYGHFNIIKLDLIDKITSDIRKANMIMLNILLALKS